MSTKICFHGEIRIKIIWIPLLTRAIKLQGPVVQNIDNLTSSLMTNSLTVIAKVFSNTLIFCCKNVSGFCSA